MILCDICGQANKCVQKEIDGKEYDICIECWSVLVERLKGKGRVKKQRTPVQTTTRTGPARTVILPSIPQGPEREEPKFVPGQPPKIWGRVKLGT